MDKKLFKAELIILAIVCFISVCFNIFLVFYNNQKQIEYKQQMDKIAADQQKRIEDQKKQKNEIADIWDDQAALNDDLVESQRKVLKSAQSYIDIMDRSIRFVDGQPQLAPNISESDILKNKNSLAQAISDIQKIALESAESRDKNGEKIRKIYLDAGEDRNKTANDRDGIR